jgi:hypothetical protein
MDYFGELKNAIYQLHGAKAVHAATVPVKEVFKGQMAWEGEVEVFDITGHAKAKRCYAWGYPKETVPGWEITTVLELPPVTSPETAVKISIAARAKLSRN